MAVSLGPSGLVLDNYTLPNNSGEGINQVKFASNNGKITVSGTSWVDVGLSVTLTPKDSNSKFFIMYSLGRATTDQHNMDHAGVLRVLRNGSNSDLNGITAGNRPRIAGAIYGLAFNDDHAPGPWSFSGVDSPGTSSSITYKLQARNQASDRQLHINGSINNSDSGSVFHGRAISYLLVMEILT